MLVVLFKKKEKLDENILKNIYKKGRLVRYAQFIAGVALVAIAFNLLVMPSSIVYGMSGVGVMLNFLFKFDPSLVILIGSLILLVLSYFLLGKEQTVNSILGSLAVPFFIKLTENIDTYIKISNDDPFLIVIVGAAVTGFGLGLVFKSGFTTGGTDILNQIVSKYFKMSLGNAMFFTDGLIIASSIFVFGWTKFMYSIVSLYIISIMTDKVVLGISKSKAFYIITTHESEVKKFITTYLNHGVTVLEARGGYTGDHKKMIMCIIPTKQYYIAKEGIHNIDPNAFFVVTDSYEVFGGE